MLRPMENLRQEFDNFFIEESDCNKGNENSPVNGIDVRIPNNTTNVVSGERLREIQSATLKQTADFLAKTFGPMGTNTKIITGENIKSISSAYSKDGLKVLSNIINSAPIEASIVEELISITKHVEHEVGDGTTSTVILSSLIFDKLMKIQEKFNIPPYQLIRKFKAVVDQIKEFILENKEECTLDDIYDIAMISTNGNVEVSRNIRKVYEDFGMNVELFTNISNSTDSMIKTYDGLTITEGYAEPSFINNPTNNTCEIRNANIYHFVDPIDTIEMVAYFDAILEHNIYEPLSAEEAPIPTVITCPRVSTDLTTRLKALMETLSAYDNAGLQSGKPPVLIITNVVASDEVIMDDIANLCGCKSIRKYIDPKIKERDQQEGKAPTIENVHTFAGKAEAVIADGSKTKFINPEHMFTINNNGERVEDAKYKTLIEFLEKEIATTKESSTAGEIGVLRKRLSALKANMVEYLVGGITIADRDATKDLVEDAIKNCKSAASYGVGHAANYEGLFASYNIANKILENKDASDVDKAIGICIFCSYYDITEILYRTVCFDSDEIQSRIENSIRYGAPYNIKDGEFPENLFDVGNEVKCSIMLDINVLDTLSKIITMMVTCNQCLLQSTSINNY